MFILLIIISVRESSLVFTLKKQAILIFSGNLNREGQEATNKYLTPTVTSSYGDVNTYVDDMTINVAAKTSTKDYPADYMVVRTTVDDFIMYQNMAIQKPIMILRYMLQMWKDRELIFGTKFQIWQLAIKYRY